MTDSQSSTRRLQHQKNLLQTLVQNGLILVDTLNTTVTYQVFSLLFFQFITLAFSMVFIRTVEGFVKLYLECIE